MIKYHGTPVGGSKRDAMLFLSGRSGLVSYAYQQHTAEVVNVCSSFCLDNGAFSIWKSGKGQVDENGYRRWVDSLRSHPAFDFFIIPDVIDGTERENNILFRKWAKVEGGVPVFHLGESVERFKFLAEHSWKVCLGSTSKWPSIGTEKWWDLFADLMDAICVNGTPTVKLHGLRMLNPKVFTKIPLHSGDSSNASVNSGVCMKKGVHPSLERWQGSERIARRIEAYQSAPIWSRENILRDSADFVICDNGNEI
jgi:hypothetical protein